MLEGVKDVLATIDNGWAVAGLVIVCVYLFAWKYGKELLGLTRRNTATAEPILERLTQIEARLAALEKEEPDAGTDGR